MNETDTSQDSALVNAIMEAAVDAILVSDASGSVIRANPAAAKLFGCDLSYLLGCSMDTLVPGALAAFQDTPAADARLEEQADNLKDRHEFDGVQQDGTVFPVHMSIGNETLNGQQLFVCILHDLTNRRAFEKALARSQRMEALGQLTGGIAHDFNNLLTVIIGNLEIMEMRGADDRQIAHIKDALDSAELGAELTSRLLIFAKKGTLNPIRTDLREVCEDALLLLRRTIGEKYNVKTDFADDVADVLVDPVQMQSALINLAINARDAMPDGGEFLISVCNIIIDDTYMAQETDIEPGEYVRLFVSDNGDGMSAEAQRRAFEPFFTTKSETGGTGLGLSMVYGFVRQSGGHITLYSELGHGTSFGLYFPMVKPVAASKVMSPAMASHDLPHGDGRHVLVVEDNPKVRRLSIERVRDLGYETSEAASGDAAYDMLANGLDVDLVFSDLVMPGDINGYDLAEMIRRDFPKVRVLLTSGYASDVVTGAMSGAEPYDILHKPYRISELANRLHALLERSD